MALSVVLRRMKPGMSSGGHNASHFPQWWCNLLTLHAVHMAEIASLLIARNLVSAECAERMITGRCELLT